MGRLQRKKNPDKVKKKTTDAGAELPEQNENESPIIQSGSVPAPVKIKKKSTVPKKISSGAKSSQQEKNFFDKTVQFLREVKIELKKVTWPSRKQTIGSTVVVLIFVIIVSAFLGLVDISLTNLIRLILR
ncbi:MAG: preprotein translocase subunit SecE [Desulfobacterales bacterium]|nr:preprotein translocase subunit SecE [Desulfobacterales bacterium]MDD4070822.1 preprotein translocase subunit SecE [Desulfobacterales bacterium]MDD4391224.1 preprotein translocase subunit SecE [Desulfobacterales bacterium]